MLSLIELISMPDPACEEGVVEDASDRGRGEHPGLCDKFTLSIRQPLGVPGAESLVTEPGCQGGQGGRPRGIALEEMRHRWTFYQMNMYSSRVLRIADPCPLPVLLHPAGLVAEGYGAKVLTLPCSLVDALLDMHSQHVREQLGHASQDLSSQLAMRSTVVQVLGDGDEAYAVMAQGCQSLQHDLEVPCPAVQGVDDHHVELDHCGILKEPLEEGPLSDGLVPCGTPFFSIDANNDPTSASAILDALAFLSIKAIAIDLALVGDSNVDSDSHLVSCTVPGHSSRHVLWRR